MSKDKILEKINIIEMELCELKKLILEDTKTSQCLLSEVTKKVNFKTKHNSNDFYIENEILLDYFGDSEVVTVPNGIKGIINAFKENSKVKKIILPDGLLEIGEYSFSCCSNLEEINIPDTVMGIGNGAFRYCWKLKDIVIPNSVILIGDNAFCGTKLKKIVLPDSIKKIGSNAFSGCPASIFVPTNCECKRNSFYNCKNVIYREK